MPQQFKNPANPEIHRRPPPRRSGVTPTATIDVLVAGVGTGGTITGVRRVLKERASRGAGRRGRADDHHPVLSRRQPPGPAQDPGDRRRVHPRGARPRGDRRGGHGRRRGGVGDGPPAAQREGILGGISAGATVSAALEVAARPGAGRQADRDGRLRLGRALHVPTLLLPMRHHRLSPCSRQCPVRDG